MQATKILSHLNQSNNLTLRQRLVNQASRWLFDWNWKAFRQEVGDPHHSDYLSQETIEYTKQATGKEPKPYAIRSYIDAHSALEHIVSRLNNSQVTAYYVNLSDRGFNRLFNEITKIANERLERRKDVYLFARNRASKGNTDWQERLERVRAL